MVVISRSRAQTPIIDLLGNTSPTSPTSPADSQSARTPTESPKKLVSRQSQQTPKPSQPQSLQTPKPSQPIAKGQTDEEIRRLLLKQSKQIRALYELQKSTLEKLTTVEKQLKKLIDKNTDLSPKVFNVSNNLYCVLSISNVMNYLSLYC